MLKQTAETGGLVTYTDVAKVVGLDMENVEHRNQMSQLLDEISSHEHAQGRPLLSVVVIRKDLGRPGHGFFELAKRLGQYSGHGEIHEVLFFVKEFQKAEQYWSKRVARRR
jgi:hypothetical protein